MGKLPTHGIYRGKMVNILHQHSKDHFMVLDHTDTKRLLHRNQFAFIKTPPPRKLKKSAFDVFH